MTIKAIIVLVWIFAIISAIWYHEIEGLIGCILGFFAGAAMVDKN